MTAFISYNSGNQTVTIDGSAQGIQKTVLEDGEAIQLRRARSEESNYDWFDKKISQVIIKKVLVYDEIDMKCLVFFIKTSIKINASEIFVAPRILNLLIGTFNNLHAWKIKVVEGSSIAIPQLNGLTGMSETTSAEAACEKLGFTVMYQ